MVEQLSSKEPDKRTMGVNLDILPLEPNKPVQPKHLRNSIRGFWRGLQDYFFMEPHALTENEGKKTFVIMAQMTPEDIDRISRGSSLY